MEKEQKEELDLFMQKNDQEFQELTSNLDKQEEELLAKHQKELKDFKTEYEEKVNNDEATKNMVKPSAEFLNWIKIKDICNKQRQYDKAHEASLKIEELLEEDIKKYNKEKEKKYKYELGKLIKRQENEKKSFDSKKNSILVLFNKAKANNIQGLNRKYKSQMKELETYQKLEFNNISKIKRGFSKPNSRIQSILKSASSFKQDE